MNVVDICGVSKNYGPFTALNDVSFQVRQGDFFALLGPNGAGKTTLISILAGLTKPSQGNIKVKGFDVQKEYKQARKLLGIVPQELVFDPFFTVRETLVFQSGYFGLKKNDSWIDELLVELGLSDKANVNMRKLSGGMKRRVLLGQALVHKPPVIVLDEPTAGVDVELRQSLWRFITKLNQQGHSIILTTHYLEEAQNLCNRIGMLKAGQLIALEDKEVLLNAQGYTFKFSTNKPLNDRFLGGVLPGSHFPNYLLSISGTQELQELLCRLHEQGFVISNPSIQDMDLETVFLSIMQDKKS